MIALRLFLAFALLVLPAAPARKGNSSGSHVLTSTGTLNLTGPTTRCFWIKRVTTTTNGRVFEGGSPYSGTSQGQSLYLATANGGPTLEVAWSTAQGNWNKTTAVSTSWEHYCVLYDDGSTSNDASGYKNGVNDSWGESAAPSGTSQSGTRTVHWFNRSSADRIADIELAEFGFWRRALSAAEITALAAGYSPKCFPASLTVYVSMNTGDGNERDEMSSGVGVVTESGTIAKADHPRIIQCQ